MPNFETVDITPSPRILRVLGEIPFQTWQCFAELMDNSIDALLKQADDETGDVQKSVWVNWSGQNVGIKDRTIEVSDNAQGMTLEQMRNAVRAGYSNNNPIGNLGLFGMGFNIATARLGSRTEIWSTTADAHDWYGIEIDFDVLARGDEFQAPLLRRPKEPCDVSGTRIVVSGLKSGTATSLQQQERDIRRTLENIYAPLLMEHNIDLYVNGKILHPKRPCVWGEDRYVIYQGHQIKAYVPIDKQLGSALFDLERNAYLTIDEQDEYSGVPEEELPANICYRERHLHGWIGIQRYFDTNDYGIDFIRNGRKILIQDKSLFSYTSTITGEASLQYPVELGTTVGGRIIGQLHVDYLLPTYQKNDFDRYDSTWYETVAAICGEGPFLPRQRTALGLDKTPDSPLGLLVNAYRRTDPGTKNLALPKAVARTFLQEFNKGNAAYLDDAKWWAAAQEYDQEKQQGNNPPANTSNTPSDDIDDLFPNDDDPIVTTTPTPAPKKPEEPATPQTSRADDLRKRATQVVSLSKKYRTGIGIGSNNPLDVKVYELKSGDIKKDGARMPFIFYPKGFECEFFYDPRHPLIQQYPVPPVQYLLLYLADKFKSRDQLDDLGIVYETLIEKYLSEERVDASYLKERAETFFGDIRSPMKRLLEPISGEVVSCIHESAGESEEAISLALSSGLDFGTIRQDSPTAYEIMEFVPSRTLLRLIDRYPDRLFDKKLFDVSYTEIELSDKAMQDRLRESAKERIVSYMKDLLYLVSTPSSSISKNDLNRVALSLSSLTAKLVDDEFSD